MIYLDNNATTPVLPEVLDAMLPFLRDQYGNPSSGHSFGRGAAGAVASAREAVASLIGAEPPEIVFLSGGTESDNLAVKGGVRIKPPNGEWQVVTSTVEHPAVLKSVRSLAQTGFRETVVPVDKNGVVNPEDVREALDAKTALVTIMHSNNETGTIEPVKKIVELVKGVDEKILVHTDAVQSAGKVPLDVTGLGVDLLSISAHKMYGPKGIGALYVRKGVKLDSMMAGGSHERGMRAGTENVAGIAGFGKACEIAVRDIKADSAHAAGLRDDFEKRIVSAIPYAAVNCKGAERLPGTSNVCFGAVKGETIFIQCDLQGIAVSTGSACSSGSVEPSHVLTAIGLDTRRAEGSIRFSFGKTNRVDEIDYLLERLPAIIESVKAQ
jgi:cysteine desulfurase